MLLWFTDLMNVTEEVTIYRTNVSTLLSSAFIRGDLNAATRGPFIRSLISCLFPDEVSGSKPPSSQFKGHIFAKPKDPVTKEQLADAIFSTPCDNCDNEYIGQTKRQFGTRSKEHQKAVFFCKKENSALSEHIYLTNHTIGWDNS